MFIKIILLICLIHCAVDAIHIKALRSPEVSIPISIVYDSKTKSVCYVNYDVPACNSSYPCLFCYDTITKKTHSTYIEGKNIPSPIFIVPVKSSTGQFVVGFGNTVYLIDWDRCSSKARINRSLFTLDKNYPSNRLGVGHKNQNGRVLYASSVSLNLCNAPANASVYLYRKNRPLVQAISDLRLPAGFAYTKKHVYTLDCCSFVLSRFKTDDNGDICCPEIVLDFKKLGFRVGQFQPLGLEADKHGNIYTVNSFDGYLWRINPKTSHAEKVIQFPYKGVTSITFGSGDDLYATLASAPIDLFTLHVYHRNNVGSSLIKVTGLGTDGTTFKRLKV